MAVELFYTAYILNVGQIWQPRNNIKLIFGKEKYEPKIIFSLTDFIA